MTFIESWALGIGSFGTARRKERTLVLRSFELASSFFCRADDSQRHMKKQPAPDTFDCSYGNRNIQVLMTYAVDF